MANTKRYVIIGTSAAGIGAINKIRSLDQVCEIIWISDEQEMPYNKCLLADFLDNSKELSQVFTRNVEFIQQNNITLLLGARVVAVDAQAQTITIDYGSIHSSKQSFDEHSPRTGFVSYSSLLIATGTRTKKIEASGNSLQGVFTYQTLADAFQIKKYVQEQNAFKVAVIGAGLSGLECADALYNIGCEITIIEAQPRLLPMLLDEQGSQFLQVKMHNKGINTFLEQKVASFVEENGCVKSAILSSGVELKIDMVVCALGAQPNSEFLSSSNIKLHSNFICVDAHQQTSQKNIFAAGDVTVVKNQLTGELVPTNRWSDAVLQGMVAGSNMAGDGKKYPGVIPWSSSSFFGVRFLAGGARVHTSQDAHLGLQYAQDFLEVVEQKDGQVSGFYLLSCRSVEVSMYKNMLLNMKKDYR